MDTLLQAHEFVSILLYILSGFSFYFCFNLLYIAGVSKQLELKYSKYYQTKFLDETGLSSENITYIWRKIHNFGLIGSLFLFLTFNLTIFLPILFILFSIYYACSISAEMKAKRYSLSLTNKVINSKIKGNSFYEAPNLSNLNKIN